VSADVTTTYAIRCDCCDYVGPSGPTEATAREVAVLCGWQRTAYDDGLVDECARCAHPEHDRARCEWRRP
jgi:hypothetical protein